MALQIADEDVGGARVRRTFTMGGEHLKTGVMLTAEQFLAIGRPNRVALVDSNYLELFPKGIEIAKSAEKEPAEPVERFMVGTTDKNKFNVIEGRLVNTEPVSRQEAEKLLAEITTTH